MNDKTNTAQFEASHGRKPHGNGSWAFEITFGNRRGAYSTETVWEFGTMAKARKAAWKKVQQMCSEAKELVEITVLP